jgi:hypothetical protein
MQSMERIHEFPVCRSLATCAPGVLAATSTVRGIDVGVSLLKIQRFRNVEVLRESTRVKLFLFRGPRSPAHLNCGAL